jgi:hypothetical protein
MRESPHCPLSPRRPASSRRHSISNPAHTPDSCGYQKSGSGICNSTVFGYPMDGFANILADVPADYKDTTVSLVTSDTFIDANYNHGMSRAGSLLIFVSGFGARARQELVPSVPLPSLIPAILSKSILLRGVTYAALIPDVWTSSLTTPSTCHLPSPECRVMLHIPLAPLAPKPR